MDQFNFWKHVFKQKAKVYNNRGLPKCQRALQTFPGQHVTRFSGVIASLHRWGNQALTANVSVSSKHAETILTVCFQLRKLRCLSWDRVCAREHTPVSRFKWHTLKLLKPDEKLHPKLFSTSILLMRGGIENRTSRLVEKEKWKLKSCLCLRLNEVLRGNTQLMKHFCNVGEESGPVFSQGCLTWGGRQNAAERECDSQQSDPILPLTLHINMLL